MEFNPRINNRDYVHQRHHNSPYRILEGSPPPFHTSSSPARLEQYPSSPDLSYAGPITNNGRTGYPGEPPPPSRDGYYNPGYIPESPTQQQNNNIDDHNWWGERGPRQRQRFPAAAAEPLGPSSPGGRQQQLYRGNRAVIKKSRKKTIKQKLEELEASCSSPAELIRGMREFIEMEDRKQTGFMAWRKQQKLRWDRFKAESKSKARFWGLWSVTINIIEGRFGIGIASYFRFLRWLFYLDLVLMVIVLSVTTLPYAFSDNYLDFEKYTEVVQKDWIINNSFVGDAKSCSLKYRNHLESEFKQKGAADHAKDVLQGTGFMEYTILFYGSYHNVTIKISDSRIYNYNMSLAYLLALGLFFVISFVLIIRTIAVGIKENLVNQESTGIPYSQKVFGSWDYCISVEKMVSRKKNCLLQELRADLNAQREVWKQIGRTVRLKIKLYSLRLLINFVVVCVLCGAFALIYYSSIRLLDLQKDEDQNTYVELSVQFLPSIVISLLNVIIPFVFKFLVEYEEYSSSYEIRITLIRITLLRLASLAILLFSLYGKLDLNSSDSPLCGHGKNGTIWCWETYVGQQFYKLIVLDFALMILVNLVFHTIRRILYNKFHSEDPLTSDEESVTGLQGKGNKCGQLFRFLINKVGPQEFDLPQNVLDIVYHQSLCWIGVFFCPLISLIITINFFLLFFIKKFTVFHNCVQSVRPFRASKSNSLFMIAVLISFLLCVLPIALAIGFFHPSRSCGPFRIYSNSNFYIFDTLSNLILSWPSIIKSIFFWIVTPPVLVPLIVLVCFLIYYYVIVGRGYKRMEDLLREQLSLDGKDKRFLLGEVNKIMKKVFAKEN